MILNCTLITSSPTYSISISANNSLRGNYSNATSQLQPWAQEPSLTKIIENILNQRVILAICIFGLIGNLLSLLVLTRKCIIATMDRMEKCAHMGLVALAISDFLFCLCTIPHSFQDSTQFDYYSVNFWLVYKIYENGIINIFIMSSTWLTVAMAMARYLAICYPMRGRQILGIKTCTVAVGVVFIFCLIFNLPRFWVKKIDYIDCLEGWRSYYANDYLWHYFPNLETAYVWLYFMMCIFIPLCVLAYCNVYLIRALRMSTLMRLKHSRSRDNSKDSKNILTLTLTIIVIFYLCLVTPAELLTFGKNHVISSTSFVVSDRYNLAIAICNTLQAVNFAFNFILYCVINAQFRRTVKIMFGCKMVEKKKLFQSWAAKSETRISSKTLYLDLQASNTCVTRL